ncbi:MAG: hypothetical protein AAGG51_30405 [Cyanobacteria bacterium P01_G01_bin.54]
MNRKIINQKEVRIIGLRRTGNHAVINWLRDLYRSQDKPALHLNDLMLDENPYRCKYENLRDYHPEHAVMMERYRQQSLGHFIPRAYLGLSYEDYSLSQINNQPKLEQNHDIYLGRSQECWHVLILRDPFNLFASRL